MIKSFLASLSVTYRRSSERGFSMLLMAVVVTIIGMAVASLLPDDVASQKAKVEETQRRLKIIRDAIHVYMQVPTNTVNRIPCPSATLTGSLTSSAPPSEGVCGTSGVRVGAVPVKDLNLSDDMVLDAWGNKIRYVVDMAYTDTSATGTTPVFISSSIVVQGNGYPPRYSNGKLFYNGGMGQVPIALLISSGADGAGAYNKTGSKNPDAVSTSLQRENQEELSANNIFFVDVFYPDQPDGKNDDIVDGIFNFGYKNCEPATPCADDMSGLPVGCVAGLGPIQSIADGEFVHGATRTATCRTTGTRTLTCSNGIWMLSGGACT